MKQMCGVDDENMDNYVMTYQEAINLLQRTYGGFIEVTDGLIMDYWQICKKNISCNQIWNKSRGLWYDSNTINENCWKRWVDRICSKR